MFDARLPFRFERNALAAAVDAARAEGRTLLDLTVSNPTAVGLPDHGVEIGAALARAGVGAYHPDPRGLASARRLLARELGEGLDPGRLLLCSCSSEAYALLFKLLCAPGERVLVPRPSYPLFEHLTALEGLEALPYALRGDSGWSLDLSSIEQGLTAGARALLLVNPNNPTGSSIDAGQFAALERMLRDAEGSAAVISDEVFADYPATGRIARARDHLSTLVFTLGGLSKSAGLPQIKLSWVVVDGPEALCTEALARLDLVADTYLTLSTAPQLALDRLLELGRTIRAEIRQRLVENRAELARQLASCPSCDLVSAPGGWTAVLRVPALAGEEQLALQLVEQDDVLVHPGYFFDFEAGAHLVLSPLVQPELFAEGLRRVLARAG